MAFFRNNVPPKKAPMDPVSRIGPVYIISVRRPSRKTTSTIPTYQGNAKKIFHLKDTTKNSIKAMDIYSLLNTDLGNLNDLSLILQDNRLSMYDTIYISL